MVIRDFPLCTVQYFLLYWDQTGTAMMLVTMDTNKCINTSYGTVNIKYHHDVRVPVSPNHLVSFLALCLYNRCGV